MTITQYSGLMNKNGSAPEVHSQGSAVQSREDQIFQLQEKLIEEYGGEEEEVILNYLTTDYCEGPTESILDAVMTVFTSEKHKHRFIPCNEGDIVYEGDGVDDDEYDIGYSPSLPDSNTQGLSDRSGGSESPSFQSDDPRLSRGVEGKLPAVHEYPKTN
ncbi:hypothetical protein BCR41DRAFT_389779 [Lobosporangium transversale]|uniref:Uncharacterized protein n=1 Tax=Lobosporangium transversale TaxID=64571 RepID=A0A1Y2GCB5_9FUNG|nr:hypothetical protein BCR41DRAFT_389779 [Lobosporangium transversale]ORZ05020.1 hypothetical protein BCR41DRAFT_389779 [Lobosporangium transversale]|eukprot:XP_021876884.1 hypothetical protein BCR41DRAFT_389779 [Lobosporangium transversale]